MEQGGFLTGVPLNAVKCARFINKAGSFFTMLKLVLNGSLYDFSDNLSNGAVLLDGQYLHWRFIAPDGKFDLDALGAMDLAEMFKSMGNTLESAPLSAWENFAAWMAEPAAVKQIQTVFDCAAYAGVKGALVEPPQFQAPKSFSAFLSWLSAMSGSAGNISASEFRVENGFNYEINLFLTKGIRIFIQTPPERPALQDGDSLFPNRIFYTSENGITDSPVLLISPALCPDFQMAYPEHDIILYAYEETHDNMGLGITLPAGWYTADSTTFDVSPFDLEKYPIVIEASQLTGVSGINWKAIYPMAEPEIVGEPDAVVSFLFQI